MRENVTRFFFDTEFAEDGRTIDLISIGMVCDDGAELYFESREILPEDCNAWVRENVLPKLRGGDAMRQNRDIARRILEFVTEHTRPGTSPEFWTYFGAYDWVLLCQLYGTMMDLPKGWPYFSMDLKQHAAERGTDVYQDDNSDAHNALADARWVKKTWEGLNQ